MVKFRGFLAKLGYFAGFSLYIINFAVRISKAAGYIIFFKVPRSSFRVKCSSLMYSIAQKDAT